jgi:hypothetical protein
MPEQRPFGRPLPIGTEMHRRACRTHALRRSSTASSRLIEMAKAIRVSDGQREEQRRSFVYGNTAFENEEVTWEMVNRQGDAIPTE